MSATVKKREARSSLVHTTQLDNAFSSERVNENIQIQYKRHQAEQEEHPNVRGSDHDPLTGTTASDRFPQKEDHMSPVENRDRQEVQNRQVDAEEAEELPLIFRAVAVNV